MTCALIVDDDDDIRETIAETLEDRGYGTARAANGKEALNLLLAGLRPKIILLDLMMPVMNGWQFQQETRHNPSFNGIPVFVITGDTMAARRAVDVGASGYLSKPFEEHQLLEIVARFCAPNHGTATSALADSNNKD
jgi:CheY-like chemotaxis protein